MPRFQLIRQAAGVLAVNLAVACAVMLLTFSFYGGRRPLVEQLINNLVFANCIGTLAACTIPWACGRLWRYRPVIRWAGLVVVLLLVSFAGCSAAMWIIFVLLGSPWTRYWPSVRATYISTAVVTLCVGITATVYEMYRRRITAAEVEREEARKLAAEAQFSSLESRVQPHFLFNTLNSISALIAEDPAKAEALVERLSRLLRSSLDSQGAALIPLSSEVKLAGDYLAIQQTRFGQRLRFEIDSPVELGGVLVPPFSIQTLVENSIKFVIAPSREGGLIRVAAVREDAAVRVAVHDGGPGFTASAIEPGRGLDNLRARLRIHFGDEAKLSLGPGGVVSFRVPECAPTSSTTKS